MRTHWLLVLIGVCGALGPAQLTRSAAAAEEGTLGPWRLGDMAYSTTVADDRPNALSQELKAKYYAPLAPDRVFKGEKGELSFRVSPRCADWAGILVQDKAGNPVLLSAGMTVAFLGADGKAVPGKTWDQKDTKVLFSDASPILLPRTTIVVSKAAKVVDQATVDFTQWQMADSRVQMRDLLDGPTSAHGFVTARDGRFFRDGKPIFFWGGHENHVSSKENADRYADVYSSAGLNLQRSIAFEEMVKDPATGELDPAQLDKYHYLIAKLGEKGIYFVISGSGGGYLNGSYGYERGKEPKFAGHGGAHFWLSPAWRGAFKAALKAAFTAVNPYNGKAIKDDPTVIGIELSNETGMNERRFDFNRVDQPEAAAEWRAAFDKFLLKKYGTREALAKAWEKDPLLPHEDPAKNTVLIPTNYRGARTPYGGTGQHDQFTTPRWYRDDARYGLDAKYNPRIVDAIEFNEKVAHKPYPFDFNNLTTPEESERLRLAFNDFLVKKYGTREALAAAWAEDTLDPWENPAEGATQPMKRGQPPPASRTVRIPSNYRGQARYEPCDTRLADPRIGDAMEFTYQVQKDWATELAEFLKKDVGMKCGIGWNGDTFHVVQAPNHLANMNSPLDIAIAAAYLDTDNGDQLTSRTKNLKRFNAYGRIYGRPMLAYEWSFWTNQGPHAYEYALLAAVMGRVYGFDAYAHHKMAAYKYPVADPIWSLPGHDYIAPLSDRPRRGTFQVCEWIMHRARIQEEDHRLIIGLPYDDVFTGGPERKMSDWAFENWLMYQIGTEDYAFKSVYDGPADRIVIHDGRGPYGDYRKAAHAILWCHSNSDREGKDPDAKKKWFQLHGIEFAPGQKYFLNDQFFATTEDMTDYNVVHRAAEKARMKAIEENQKKDPKATATGKTLPKINSSGGDDYWAAEPDFKPTELDHQLYQALKKWGYPLPFEESEIDKVWRSRDRTMAMDTTKLEFRADRDDMQLWFGKLEGRGGKISLSRLAASSGEKQFSAALLPWDTADLATAKTLAVWCMWNGEVTVKLPMPPQVTIYAVNWLGKRLYQVRPVSSGRDSVTFATIRDDDIFCYEIGR